jgi:hypothetical protein
MGMHPLFFGARVVFVFLSRPYAILWLAMSAGFLKSFLLREKRAVDSKLMQYIRKEQLQRLSTMHKAKKK